MRGLECPFRRLEDEEEDNEEEEDQAAREFEKVIPLAERRRGADAVRGANVVDFTNAVAMGETRKALERMAAIQNVGGLQSIPQAGRLGSQLREHGPQGIMAVLTALALTALFRGMPAGRLGTTSLAVAMGERRAAQRFSMLNVASDKVKSPAEVDAVRKLFGFGPKGGGSGSDVFSETGF